MWLFTKDGFVSVVKDKYCKPDEVTVRARIREDLIHALEKAGLDAEILEIDHADYRFRAIIKQEDFAVAAARIAMEIDYSNFKNEACPFERDNGRAVAYHSCWDALRGWQEAL